MTSNIIGLCAELNSLGMTEFSQLDYEELQNLSTGAIQEFLEIIQKLDLGKVPPCANDTLNRLVHLLSTIRNETIYPNYFEKAQGNIRVMMNREAEKSGTALYRSSQKTYDYAVGQKIDFGNRSFSESLEVAEGFAGSYGGKTIFEIYGEFYRINFKNDSMNAAQLECRIKRSTTGVVKRKWVDARNGVQHYEILIEEHPDEQTYDENVTGTANTHYTNE